MARKVWVIPASAQIDDATIAAASAAACTEIAVGIPPQLAALVTPAQLPTAVNEPDPVVAAPSADIQRCADYLSDAQLDAYLANAIPTAADNIAAVKATARTLRSLIRIVRAIGVGT